MPLRRLLFGLATLSGLATKGYFVPYRHAARMHARGYPALEPLFVEAMPRFEALLADIESHAAVFDAMAANAEGPRFTQDWFPRLDACAAYAMVRRERPRRIVEIGSGHSTRFMAQAVMDGGIATSFTCIDPQPRASIRHLPVQHVATLLDDADPALFAELADGDILFIDSSHVALPGTDCDRLFLDVLPRLPPGVWVHVHDVVLPDPYPPVMAQWEWNEQMMVAALLQGAYALEFSSHYVATRMARAVQSGVLARLPLPATAIEASLWMRKREK